MHSIEIGHKFVLFLENMEYSEYIWIFYVICLNLVQYLCCFYIISALRSSNLRLHRSVVRWRCYNYCQGGELMHQGRIHSEEVVVWFSNFNEAEGRRILRSCRPTTTLEFTTSWENEGVCTGWGLLTNLGISSVHLRRGVPLNLEKSGLLDFEDGWGEQLEARLIYQREESFWAGGLVWSARGGGGGS